MAKYLTKKESAQAGARQHFRKRVRYLADMKRQNAEHINVVDFNKGEKIFYGRVNRYYAPITLDISNNGPPIKTIKMSRDSTQPIQAVSFVAETFDLMCEQFKKDAARGKLVPSAYLTNLRAYKGFQDPQALYAKYRRDYANRIKNKIQRKNLKFTNFDEFVSLFLQETQFALQTSPFTYPGFIKSKYNNILTTGLAIEIAPISYNSDFTKMAAFVNSPNWKYFAKTCSSFGFMIDQNVPWRIVADMSRTASTYRSNNLNIRTAPLELLYTPAGFMYMSHFLDDLLELYNNVRVSKFEETTFCDGKLITTRYNTRAYTADQIYKLFTPEKKIALYCTLRLNEEKSNLHDNAKKMIINDCLSFYQGGMNMGTVLKNFENCISKTFDSIGSYTYIKNNIEKQTELALENQKQLDGAPSVISNY
tara:strand:- start:109 stop:1371 length:1263 start_codon:yes stop_codon:yes gene_type:complete